MSMSDTVYIVRYFFKLVDIKYTPKVKTIHIQYIKISELLPFCMTRSISGTSTTFNKVLLLSKTFYSKFLTRVVSDVSDLASRRWRGGAWPCAFPVNESIPDVCSGTRGPPTLYFHITLSLASYSFQRSCKIKLKLLC